MESRADKTYEPQEALSNLAVNRFVNGVSVTEGELSSYRARPVIEAVKRVRARSLANSSKRTRMSDG